MSLQTPNESTRTGRLPLPLILAIVALALVTVFVIIAVFTGNMNTYGGEVVVTVVYFAVFVLTLLGHWPSRAGPVPSRCCWPCWRIPCSWPTACC